MTNTGHIHYLIGCVLFLNGYVQIVIAIEERLFCGPGEYCDARGSKCLCIPCPPGSFQTSPGVAIYCAQCKTHCIDRFMDLVETCSPIQDNTCKCKNGTFLQSKSGDKSDGYCKKHKTCLSGSEVKANGTSEMDTQCEPCVHGKTFLALPISKCLPCTKCQSGHIMPCNVSADAVCISIYADNTGMIVGIVLGSVIVVLASVIVGCICRYRRSLPTLTCCSSSSRQVNREDGMEEKTLQPTAVAGDIILEEKIIEIGAQLIKEWKMFFRHLYRESGLDNADTDIDEMKHEYEKDGIKECIHQLFLCWMRKMGNRVNIETNIDAINLALSKCNRLDLSIERPSYRHDRVVNLVEC